MTKELSRLNEQDYDILSTSDYRIPGETIGVDSPEFGKSSLDYIEMVVLTPNDVILDSFVIARGTDCENYKSLNDEGQSIFKINPGIFMREKGYFSGEYNVRFNFLREIAGSEKGVLVDKTNTIYNGQYFVSQEGLIYKKGEINPDQLEKDEFLLTEKDYKYYIDEISSDRKELRLATYPYKSDKYKTEFKGLGSDDIVLTFGDNRIIKQDGNKSFEIENNADDKLTELMVGSKIVIRDAFKVPGLTITSGSFDCLVGLIAGGGLETTPILPNPIPKGDFVTYGGNIASSGKSAFQTLASSGQANRVNYSNVYGGDNNYYTNTITKHFRGADGLGKSTTRNGYNSAELLGLAQSGKVTELRNLLFHDTGTGKNENFNFTEQTQLWITKKLENPDKQWYDGAAVVGWVTYISYGFPLWIRCNEQSLEAFKNEKGLNSYFTIRVSGRDTTVDENQQLETYNEVEYGPIPFEGENSFFRIPKHPQYTTKKQAGNVQEAIQGAVFDISLDFVIEFGEGDNKFERKYTFNKPNVFAVSPDDNGNRLSDHIVGGFE